MHDRAGAAQHDTTDPAGIHGRMWLVLAVACAAEFMVVLDASVVNVALPAIAAGLGFDPLGLSWVVNAYVVVFAGFLLLGGRLADLYGRARVFTAGLVVFVTASAVGGLAAWPAMLIAARAVQALGAAVLAPASLTILTTTFTEGPARVRALAIWTALASGGGAAGSLLGGVLTDLWSWRATLLINIPIGAVALATATTALADHHPWHHDPGHAPPGRRTSGADRSEARRAGAAGRLDIPGAVAVTVGVSALTYAVTSVAERGATTTTGTAFVVAALGLGGFVAHEAWGSRAPLVPPRLLRLPAVALGNTAMLLAGMCLMPMWYFLSLYMQQVLGLSALQTGLGFLPHTLITVAVGAGLAPRLMARVPARSLIAVGSLLTAAGFYWQSHLGPDSTYLSAVLGPAIVASVGGGLLNTPLTTTATSGARGDDAGAASGLMNTTKQVGGALGLAALVALAAASTATGSLDTDPAELTAAFGIAFTAMAAMMILVAALAYTLPRPARHER